MIETNSREEQAATPTPQTFPPNMPLPQLQNFQIL